MPALVSCSTIEHDIEDIEDIAKTTFDIVTSGNAKHRIALRKTLTKCKANKEPVAAESLIPGSQSIFIKTWGCTHNTSDSEYMAGQLSSYGYVITDSREDADLWLLNSCTVKNPAEDHLRNEIKNAKTSNKFLVIAGCVSQAAPKSPFLEGLSLIGVQQIDRIIEVVEETLKGHSVRLLGQKKENGKKKGGASLLLPKIRKNPYIEIIPINTGCLNQCTYCKTRYARGHLGSYRIEEIVERAVQAFNEGVCEIWLTSEDTGAYGRDLGVVLPDLLWELVKVVPEGCRIRLGMTNPPYILDHLEEIAKILALSCYYGFLHIPVQSGSDQVLSDMKREYTVQDFEKVVNYLKDRVPGITIATDLICGFPTETEEDFQETMVLVEKHKFPSLFINQFYPRSNTPAAKLPRIPTNIVKQRTKRVSSLFQKILPYDGREGNVYRVLVTEISHDNKHYVGHNKFYEQVLIPKDDDYMGKMLDVEIISTGKHYMMAKVLKNGVLKSPAIALLQNTVKNVQKNIEPERQLVNVGSEERTWKMFALYVLIISIVLKFLNKYWLHLL